MTPYEWSKRIEEAEDRADSLLDEEAEGEAIDETGDEEYERPSNEMMEYWKRGGR